MNGPALGYSLALLSVGLTVLGQMALKCTALRGLSAARGPTLLLLGLGYAALLAAVLVTTHTLRLLEVNVVVSLTALCYPLVIGLSGLFFSERLTPRQWAGLAVVCCGVAVYNLG